MAIELPGPVSDLLNFVGIPWINIDEDKVREFATEVRKFASNISQVHGDATSTLKQLGSGYQGAAYEALMNMWGSKFESHIGEVTEACGVLATALDAGADFIEAQKIACIAELAVMAGEFVADQAAAVATAGIAEAALPVIEEATDKLIEFTEQELEQYLIGEIANAALQPLMGKIDSMIEGLVFGGGGSSGGAVGDGFEIDTGHVRAQAAQMKEHATTVRGHVSDFTGNVRSMDFSS